MREPVLRKLIGTWFDSHIFEISKKMHRSRWSESRLTELNQIRNRNTNLITQEILHKNIYLRVQ